MVLYFEYEEIYNQRPIDYKDLTICRINHKDTSITVFAGNLEQNMLVSVPGYLNENTSKEFEIND